MRKILPVLLLIIGLATAVFVSQNQTNLENRAGDFQSAKTFRLVYFKYYNEPSQIFSGTYVGGNFANPKKLTTKGLNIYPTFTGTGQNIIFISERDGIAEVYSMNPDGTNQSRLTTSNRNINQYAGNWYPQSSPDGKKIVFESTVERADSQFDIYIGDFDGQKLTNKIRLTNSPLNTGAVSPTFTRDGKHVLYFQRHDKTLRQIDLSGLNDKIIRTYDGTIDEGSLSVSQNGDLILYAFSKVRPDGNIERTIRISNIDGSNTKTLIKNSLQSVMYSPAFSPDERTILFIKRVNGKDQIWTIGIDGSNQKSLITGTAHFGISAGNPWIVSR